MNYKLREMSDLEMPNYDGRMYHDPSYSQRKINDTTRATNTAGMSNAQVMDIVHGSLANEKAMRRIEEINESKKSGFRFSWEQLLGTKLVNKSL